MGDIATLIRDAWSRIRQQLDHDPHDLAKRLARRRRPTLMRSPRAWCLALRASDHRLVDFVGVDRATSIYLNADDLRQLCAPVDVYRAMRDEAAQQLGTTPSGLTMARLADVFSTAHYPGLAGRRGKPIPVLTSHDPLDPSANLFAKPDRAWDWTADSLLDRIPDTLEANLTRVAVYRSHSPKHRYDDTRHPDLDDAPPPSRRRRLPQPLIDPACWYKYSRSGHYLGSDPSNWRKDFQDLGERPARDLPKRHREKRIRPGTSKGSEHFNGHYW